MALLTRPRSLGLLGAVLAVAVATPIIAAADELRTADSAFQEGRALMERGEFAAACERFDESFTLEPAVGTKLNLGECYERGGRYLPALRAFEAGAEAADSLGKAQRGERARERARLLLERIPTMTLIVPSLAKGIELRFDDALLSRELWGTPVPVEKGAHVSDARAPGRS